MTKSDVSISKGTEVEAVIKYRYAGILNELTLTKCAKESTVLVFLRRGHDDDNESMSFSSMADFALFLTSINAAFETLNMAVE